MYNEDKIFNEFMRDFNSPQGQYFTVDPVPEKLEAQWFDGVQYYVAPLMDDSSILWVDVIQDTLEDFSDLNWTVDDPGTLYPGDWDGDDEFDESPIDVDLINKWLEQALANYSSLYKRLTEAGVSVS